MTDMSITKRIAELITRFGNDFTVRSGDDEIKTKAFIQPLRYKNKMYTDGEFLPQGYYDGGHYLFIGRPESRLGDTLAEDAELTDARGKGYIVKRAEMYTFCDEPIYVWAIVTPACARKE